MTAAVTLATLRQRRPVQVTQCTTRTVSVGTSTPLQSPACRLCGQGARLVSPSSKRARRRKHSSGQGRPLRATRAMRCTVTSRAQHLLHNRHGTDVDDVVTQTDAFWKALIPASVMKLFQRSGARWPWLLAILRVRLAAGGLSAQLLKELTLQPCAERRLHRCGVSGGGEVER
jgi:hypothetical protein